MAWSPVLGLVSALLTPWLLSLALVNFESRVNRRQKETEQQKPNHEHQNQKGERKIEITDVTPAGCVPTAPAGPPHS